MKYLKHLLNPHIYNDFFSFKYSKTKEILLFFGILLLFLVNASYVMYPDEFVNIWGGRDILMGKLPYVDFFDHHLPLAWYLSAFLLILSFGKFVLFRYWWAVFMFSILAGVGIWIRKHYRPLYPFYLLFLALYPLMAVYFWFHLFLADSLGALFFSAAFWILMTQTLSKKFSFKATIAASLLTCCMVFSSLTYIYLGILLYAWQMYLVGFNLKNQIKLILTIVTPYILYLLFLLVTGSFKDFWFANFVYNTELYISVDNYSRGSHFNPFKFGLTIIYNFWTHFYPLLTSVKDLDFYNPSARMAALGGVSLIVLLFFRNPLIAVLFFVILSFSAPRSNVYKLSETDYQMSLFLVLGIISVTQSLFLMQAQKFDGYKNDLKRLVQLLLSIYFIFTFIFLAFNTFTKFYLRYTQQMPSIANVHFTANAMNQIVRKGDYFWIGPYEPDAEFFVKQGMLPGKYPTLLPQFRENEYLKKSFIEQFEKHPPQYIIFKGDASIFNTPSTVFGEFFLNWMKGKYEKVEEIKNVEVLYDVPNTFNMKSDLYIKIDQEQELVQRLKDAGFIRMKTESPSTTPVPEKK
jgi:hypothetical protein